MGIAIAVLNWTPAVFWASTPHETFAAIEVRAEMNRPSSE